MITFDDFKKVELRVGIILEAISVEGSEKLLKLSVDFGEEKPRTVVSGIAQHVDTVALINSQKIFVTNLEPRDIMSIPSEAMLLAGKDGEGLALACISRDMPAGTLLS